MKRAFALSAVLLASACGFAAGPHAAYFYPSGIQAGTTNRIIIGGQALHGLRGVYFGDKGLKVLSVEMVPAFAPPSGMQRRHLKKWLDGIAAGVKEEPPKPDDPHISEWRSNSWWQALGELDPLKLSIVERNLFVPRIPFQDSPALRQMCIATVAADPDVKPGRYFASLWRHNGISAPRAFAVSAARRVAEPLYTPPHRTAPEVEPVDVGDAGTVLDGQIMPGSTDTFRLRMHGGKRYRIKVTARELQPYIGDAVPGFFNPVIRLKDASGAIVASADDAERFRPDPSMVFSPRGSGVYALEIRDALFRGRADFVYAIAVDPVPTPAPKRANARPDAAERAPGVFVGSVRGADGVSRCEFSVDAPGPRVFEVTARRTGSPLDAVLVLRKANGEILARWDDATNKFFVGTVPQTECDPRGRYDFVEAGRYVAEISDRTGHGGPGYFWKLEIRAPRPGFKVYSARSALPLIRGAPLKVDFIALREDGFDGDIAIRFPDGVNARNRVFPPGAERITAELVYAGARASGPGPAEIFAEAQVGGNLKRVKVVPCDECEQAFAWKHLVPAKTFVLFATPKPKPKPKPNPKTPAKVPAKGVRKE